MEEGEEEEEEAEEETRRQRRRTATPATTPCPTPLPSPAALSSPVAAPRRYHYNVSNHRLDVHVSKGFDDGLYISSVCACGDLWAIIMHAGTGFSQQVGCTAWGGLAGCARYRQSKYGCSQLAAFLPGWPWHGSRGPLFF